MILGCICGGIIEVGIALFLGAVGGSGWAWDKRKKKQQAIKDHGIHGDEECECECHHNHKDKS